MGDGQDLDRAAGEAKSDRIGEATDNVATQPMPLGPVFGSTRDEVRGSADGPREFVAQARTLFLVPENGVSEIGLCCCREVNRYPLSRGTAGLQFGFDLREDAFGRYRFSAASLDLAQPTLDFVLPCGTQLAIPAIL